MKKSLFIFILLSSIISLSQKRKVHINPGQLIENKIDWKKLDVIKPEVKKELITSLIEDKKIFLCHSGNINKDKDLDKFMEMHAANFHLIDLNADGTYELVFNGYDCEDTDNEFLYIYAKSEDKYNIVYTKKGNIIGYKTNPNTEEILLIHYNYPCCRNGTNNLNTLRFVDGKVIEFRKELFIGRINHMVGPFLPDSIDRNGKVITANKEIELRWSSDIVDTLAWKGTYQKNIILAYKKGSKFRVLAKKKNKNDESWLFVISRSAPILSKGYIVEPSNFKTTKVYGWIREDDF